MQSFTNCDFFWGGDEKLVKFELSKIATESYPRKELLKLHSNVQIATKYLHFNLML